MHVLAEACAGDEARESAHAETADAR